MRMRSSYLILSFFLFVLFFQNCQPSFRFLNQEQAGSDSRLPFQYSSENGTGYTGKLLTFYVGASDVVIPYSEISGALQAGDHVSVTPELPAGLKFDSAKAVLSGTPQNPSVRYETYQIVIDKANGQTVTAEVFIGVGYVYFVDAQVEGEGNPDANLLDRLCADVNGVCSLKAALDQAQANPVKSRIVLPAKLYLLGPSGGLTISQNVEIVGQGMGLTVLDGQDMSRVIDSYALDVTIKNLSITRGKASGIQGGAGIMFQKSESKLELIGVELSNNNATYNQTDDQTGPGTDGGGLYFNGEYLFISGSHIHSNKIEKGTNLGYGGGISVSGPATIVIKKTVIADNRAGKQGGGIYFGAFFRSALIEDVVMARNTAGESGGALFFWNSPITIKKSAFIDNVGETGYGGAITLNFIMNTSIVIENTTFAKNRAQEGGAFAELNNADQLPRPIFIRNSTFAENSTFTSSGGAVFRLSNNVEIDLVNTIVSSSGEPNCKLDGFYTPGLIVSSGHNIESGNSCGLKGANDLINTNPLLAPLTSLGPTFVYPLQNGSPAIDSASPASCLPTDQLGVLRPRGLGCDRGASEH